MPSVFNIDMWDITYITRDYIMMPPKLSAYTFIYRTFHSIGFPSFSSIVKDVSIETFSYCPSMIYLYTDIGWQTTSVLPSGLINQVMCIQSNSYRQRIVHFYRKCLHSVSFADAISVLFAFTCLVQFRIVLYCEYLKMFSYHILMFHWDYRNATDSLQNIL